MIHKPIFSGLLHTGLPNLQSLYKVPTIQLISRTKYSGWSDPLGVPTEQWYNSYAADTSFSSKIILFDHEAWPYSTQAERQATAQKYVQIYQEMKSRRPDVKIGWYMDPIRRDFWRATKSVTHVDYLAWQQENTDLGQIMGPYTDIYMPSLYFFYSRDLNPQNMDFVGMYVERNLEETQRIRKLYGKLDSPIYPYVWYRKHNNTRDLDIDVWETIVRTILDEADGIVLWGGWQVQWDENAPWWVSIRSRLTDKRRTT